MKRIKILFLLVCVASLLASCNENDEKYEPVYGSRTVLVYIAANNSLSGFDSEDVREMVKGMANTEGTGNNLLVYLAGRNNTPKLIRLIRNGKGEVKQETVMNYGEHNSVSVDVMKDVFTIAFSRYPADSYGLVLWSHGDGWLPKSSMKTRWWGQDKSNYMDITELHNALRNTPHLNFLLFDACFMQSVEALYELRECADYIIGSPTEIPSPGAPYQKVVPAMFANNLSAVDIAKAYFEFYADEDLYTGNLPSDWNSGDPWTAGVSVSVVKTSMLDQLANISNEIIPKYIKDKQDIAMTNIFCYDCRSIKYYYDFDGFMRSLNLEAGEYEAWKAAYDEVVVYWKTTPNNYSAFRGSFPMNGSTGLSTYIFRNLKDENINLFYRQSIQWYFAAGWDKTGW